MVKWLYNSQGDAIAFISGNDVFSKSKRYIGRLRGNEIWLESYKGEVVYSDRFFFNFSRSIINNHRPLGVGPRTPPTPHTPETRGLVSLPTGYRDVELE